MKRLFAATVILFSMLAASSAQAAFMWNWTIAKGTTSEISGTLMTTQGYTPGPKTIESLILIDNGPFNDLGEVTYFPNSGGFEWDGNEVSAYDFSVFGQGNIIVCDSGDTPPCLIAGAMSGSMLLEGSFEAAPVPIPAAAWLFMSGLLGLVWKGRKARQSV